MVSVPIPNAMLVTNTVDQPSNTCGELNLSCSLGAFPASSVQISASRDQRPHCSQSIDPISTSAVSVENATAHLEFYKNHMDRYLHFLLFEEDTVSAVRSRSPVLLSAICTSAAYCTESEDFQPCLAVFEEAISKLLFASSYSFDDVRALCVGAMWISDVSLACHGLGKSPPRISYISQTVSNHVPNHITAVRIAGSLSLHRCITKMPHTKYACYERTRLYYIVCLMDHHCSLAFGRPTMTSEWPSLRDPKSFLQSLHCRAVDFGLISQVELWSISRRVFERFGADVERKPGADIVASVTTFVDAYERWRKDWIGVLAIRNHDDDDEKRTFDVYLLCAKLFLLSHIFRGRTKDPSSLSMQVIVLEQQALDAAMGVLRCFTNQQTTERWLKTLPSYFEAMISFSCLFLVKTLRHEGPTTDETKIDHIRDTLRGVSTSLQHTHTGDRIAKQLHELGAVTDTRYHKPHVDSNLPAGTSGSSEIVTDFDFDQLINSDFGWNFPGFNEFWTCSHDVQLDIL